MILPADVLAERWSAPLSRLAVQLVRAFGPDGAHQAADVILGRLSNVERAALSATASFWLREKQRPPQGEWSTWGKLEARGTGKTTALASFIVDEVQAGRARSIGLAAQNYVKTVEVQVGGILRASPPWAMPEWIASHEQLRWPNGAVAYARSPEVPGAIRSENHELTWLSEIQSWPAATREEAYMNFAFCTRIGYARTIWDSTPKRGHPLLKRFLASSASNPTKHIVVRGTIYENPYIARSALEKLESEFSGTRQGREELLGEMLDESENALVKQAWIESGRRPRPDVLVRRVISVDPAGGDKRRGSDMTGILDAGLGSDQQLYVLGDHTGRLTVDQWPELVLRLYAAGRCDCVLLETNYAGRYLTANLRAHAGKHGVQIVEIERDATTRHVPGTVYVKGVKATGSKEERAQPLATAYERGRVSHVRGVELALLEERLTTWEPGQRSPDAIDALAHAATELLGLLDNTPDHRAGFRGLTEASRALAGAPRGGANLATLLGGGRGGRI